MTEIIYQSTVTDGVHTSQLTEHGDGSINLKVTGPSEGSELRFDKGTICAKKINVINEKDAE